MKNIHILLLLILFSNCSSNTKTQVEEKSNSKTDSIYQELTNTEKFIGNYKSKVMILGTFHFSNPGLDTYKPKYEVNIFSEQRQNEIDELLEKIAQYKPTKILVEVDRKNSDSILNIIYSRYLKNDTIIKARSGETFQVGFKLAKKMKHQRIYASDSRETSAWFGVEDFNWDGYEAYQKSKNQYKKSIRYENNYEAVAQYEDSMKVKQTLIQYYIAVNSLSTSLKDHQQYLTSSALGGAGDTYVGADVVTRWYRRNLHIFSNVYDITDFSTEERILMIYGGSHVWQLRQFFKDSPDFEYVEINKYLKR